MMSVLNVEPVRLNAMFYPKCFLNLRSVPGVKKEPCRKHFFIVKGHRDWDHDGDVWIGIYDNPMRLKRAYEKAVNELEKEIKKDEENPFETSSTLEIMISAFDEDDGVWIHDIDIDDVYGWLNDENNR